MRLGMIGLGRMGMNMVRRLLQGDHSVVAYNRSPEKTKQIGSEGAETAFTLEELVSKLPPPRIIWIMLPAGNVVDLHIEKLCSLLAAGDTIIEGGNSRYTDDVRRAEMLKQQGLHYIDAGVSGGIWGLEKGYCTMIGGEKDVFSRLEPIFTTLAPADGYLYCGAAGAGHFVKMIHNGIEYGMMQAYGEGFALLESSPYADQLDYSRLAHLWNQGSVIRSWLLELMETAFREDPRLNDITGYVDDSGEGRWTAEQAIQSGVAAPVITQALFARFQSRDANAFSNRVLAAMRREFGGHAVKKSSGQ